MQLFIIYSETRINNKNVFSIRYNTITMKFYETQFEEYCHSVEQYNMHPEMIPIYEKFPKKLPDIGNIIVYGPPGVGKYSQVLHFLKKYSPSELKYEKKINCETDKQTYHYHISDIHYEIDMSLLGCNSKMLWHEIFFQIVDIIAVKPEKTGIIVCKNFHMIHNELLDIFYSYIQHYSHAHSHIKLKFVLLTEHVSFIPKNIVDAFLLLHICRPNKTKYTQRIIDSDANIISSSSLSESFIQRINRLAYERTDYRPHIHSRTRFFIGENDVIKSKSKNKIKSVMDYVEPAYIMNTKEIMSFSLMNDGSEIPRDNFNTICNNIIQEMLLHRKLSFTQFRDTIYDILVYNLDVPECLWYVFSYFIQRNIFTDSEIMGILEKTYIFLKYYNNNYRPIYHLESMFFYIINILQKNK